MNCVIEARVHFLIEDNINYYESKQDDLPSNIAMLRARRASDGKTALHLCALEGNMALVKLLLKYDP